MRRELLKSLACPDCRGFPILVRSDFEGGLGITAGELVCTGCSTVFPVLDGIPVMLPSGLQLANKTDTAKQLKCRQIEHYDAVGASELEVSRPHGQGPVQEFLLQTKIDAVLDLYGKPIAGRRVLDVCCGSGMDAELLAQRGVLVTGVDISIGALRGAQARARRYGLTYDLLAADVEALPFRTGSFPLTFVHDGLHHLLDPQIGLSEMQRVAQEAVLVTEPARAVLTGLMVRLGAAIRVEKSGNPVYRPTCAEMAGWLGAGGRPASIRRYLMYYRQEPLPIFQWFESPAGMVVFTRLYNMVNRLAGRWGNKIAAVGWLAAEAPVSPSSL